MTLQQVTAGGDIAIFLADQAAPLREAEAAYLQGLYLRCNELAQASEVDLRPDLVESRPPRLQHVYVDLATESEPTLAQALARLPLPPSQRQQLLTALTAQQQHLEPGTPRPRRLAADAMNAALPDDDLKKLEERFQLAEGSLGSALRQKLAVLEVLQAQRQWVLLGDPGGGKSTLTQRLAGVLASAIRPQRDADEERWLNELISVWGRWLLPVRLEFSRWAAQLTTAAPGVAADLVNALVQTLAHSAPVDPDALRHHLVRRLKAQPPTLLILLDGLDEVSDEQQRQRALQAVADFQRSYGDVPLLLTCRVRPYQAWVERAKQKKSPWLLQGLPDFTLAPLSPQAIADFIQRWHGELVWAERLTASTAEQAQLRLRKTLANPNRRDLREMAGTPLLLTMMVRINQRRPLPESRAELYNDYVNELLWEWERRKLDDRGEETTLEKRLAAAHVKRDLLEDALAQLAFSVHGEAPEGDTVEIPQHQVEQSLRRLFPDPDDEEGQAAWAAGVLKLIYDRAGLIYATDRQTYRFRHRTFQEYLAARQLISSDPVTNLAATLDEERWREAIFLAFGHQISVVKQPDQAMMWLNELLPDAPANAPEWRRVLLLGEVYAHLLGEQRVRQSRLRKLADTLRQSIPTLLTAALQHPDLPARQRLEAGLLLTRGVNDPPGLGLDIDPPGLDDFVAAPGWAFKMARYPVTNKQFKRFVEAGGYGDPQWWSKDGLAYKQKYDWTQPRLWDEPNWNRHSQPVVGVSWYEAEAYCAWLTVALRQAGGLRGPETVCLPTQAQWLTAAHAEQQAYPWGDTFDPANANTKESNLQQTTPVHMYPAGVTAAGVWDLSGNVWEWSADWNEGKYPYIKGGSYYWGKDDAKSSARFDYYPYRRYAYLGLRCVVFPIARA